MIHVFFYRATGLHPRFDFYLQQLPLPLQQKVLKFRDSKDAERSLFGKLLLLKGLEFMGLTEYQLENLCYTDYQRPYFNQEFDFNIAHSGDYTICAMSKTNVVGIDVEEIKPTALSDFKAQFTPEEWASITTSADSLRDFYTLWTQKEATIKAFGEGLSIPLKKIRVADWKAVWDDKVMHLFALDLNPAYAFCLATDNASPEIVVHQAAFD